MIRIPLKAWSILALIALLAGEQARAHAFLRDATPAVGSTVAQAPMELVIDFTEAVEPLFSTIAVTDRAGHRVDIGRPHLHGSPARLAVALRPLAAGTYMVTWHATATDTHTTQGSFNFTVSK